MVILASVVIMAGVIGMSSGWKIAEKKIGMNPDLKKSPIEGWSETTYPGQVVRYSTNDFKFANSFPQARTTSGEKRWDVLLWSQKKTNYTFYMKFWPNRPDLSEEIPGNILRLYSEHPFVIVSFEKKTGQAFWRVAEPPAIVRIGTGVKASGFTGEKIALVKGLSDGKEKKNRQEILKTLGYPEKEEFQVSYDSHTGGCGFQEKCKNFTIARRSDLYKFSDRTGTLRVNYDSNDQFTSIEY